MELLVPFFACFWCCFFLYILFLSLIYIHTFEYVSREISAKTVHICMLVQAFVGLMIVTKSHELLKSLITINVLKKSLNTSLSALE